MILDSFLLLHTSSYFFFTRLSNRFKVEKQKNRGTAHACSAKEGRASALRQESQHMPSKERHVDLEEIFCAETIEVLS